MNGKRTIFTADIDFAYIIETSIILRDFITSMLDIISETNDNLNFQKDSIMIKSFFKHKFEGIIDYLTKKNNECKHEKDVMIDFDLIINPLNEIMDLYELLMSGIREKYGSELQTFESNFNLIFSYLNNYILQLCTCKKY